MRLLKILKKMNNTWVVNASRDDKIRELIKDGSAIDKFLSKIILSKNCWIWGGFVNNHGYGVFCCNYEDVAAHRFSFMLFKRHLRKSLSVDHLCSIRKCVNPEHLDLVNIKENLKRAINSRKACKRGHKYAEGPYKIGEGRACMTCHDLAYRRKKYGDENAPSKAPADRTHCKWGHEFSGYNVIIRNKKHRNCRECVNRQAREYRKRKRNRK